MAMFLVFGLVFVAGLIAGSLVSDLRARPVSEEAIEHMIDVQLAAVQTRRQMADITRQAFETMAEQAEQLGRGS